MKKAGVFLSGFFCFVLFVALGANVAMKSWGGYTYVNASGWSDSKRDPAAIGQSFIFSHIRGDIFRKSPVSKMLENAQLQEQGHKVALVFGHFLIKTKRGKKIFACHQYDRVQAVFSADGFASSGEKPTMVVEGYCNVGEDINRIAPLWIPIKQIVQNQPSNGEFLSGEFSSKENAYTKIRFAHMGLQWPERWSLTRVRFYSSLSSDFSGEGGENKKETIIGKDQIKKHLSQKKLSLNWDKWLSAKQ